MTYYYFQKIFLDGWCKNNDEWVIVFEQGEMGKPVCLLDKEAMTRLIKEWNEAKSEVRRE